MIYIVINFFLYSLIIFFINIYFQIFLLEIFEIGNNKQLNSLI